MNGRAHRIVGTASGVVVAGVLARNESGVNFALETMGGGVGGLFGGQLPNIFDPPSLGPRHRRFAHSWTALGVNVAALVANVPEIQEDLRARSRARWDLAGQSSGLERCWNSLVALFWQVLAGFVPGVLAGYASHLAIDALTPAGLPVIV